MTRKEAIRQTHQSDVLQSLGFTSNEADALRRISITLHRWSELTCNGVIQRDGDNGDGKPFWYSPATGNKLGAAVDRERGAMKRLQVILAARNARDRDNLAPSLRADGQALSARALRSYVQSDPRGAALYIIRPGDVPEGADASSYYSRGICVY